MKLRFPALLLAASLGWSAMVHAQQTPAPAAAPTTQSLLPNGTLTEDKNADNWPDGWPVGKAGASWESEGDIRFIRLKSTVPDEMVMLYVPVTMKPEVKALQLKFKARVSDLTIGTSAWFDARVLLEFKDQANGKVAGGPGAPNFRKNTEGWVEKTVSFLVPEGAATLAMMPCLFKVKSGTFDITDLSLTPTDPEVLIKAKAEADKAKAEKQAATAASRRTKAAAAVQPDGSLISNGDFEKDGNADSWPDKWGKPKSGGSWETEEGNRFLRMTSTVPDQMTMLYQTYDIPEGIDALELTWKERVTGLKKGKMPWFDARILFEFKDAAGNKLPSAPGAASTGKDSKGWVEKSKRFLVPPEALTLVVMPALFQVTSGTMDIDNIALKKTDPAPILAEKADREKAEAARYVPPEEPNKANWPKMLKVVGNRLHDTDGKEVWLQGVNAGGLETIPSDKQVIKSVVVAIDDWKSNCVRLPMKEEFWYGKSPYQKDGGEEYRKIIDQIVTLTANRGAYLVLDLHRFRAPKQEHADFWKDAAEHYKDHPAVLFDIFNEPHGISWEVWKKGGYVGNKEGTDESAFLTPEEKKKNQGFESVGMQGLIDAVRSTGAKNIIIAGGLFWCNDLSGIVNGYELDDKGGNGIMYSWHTYNWHKGWQKTVVPTAEKHPIFLGEVGADEKKMDFIPLEAQEDPYTFIPDMLGFIQKYKINWTGWCLHPRATPVMISDWNYTPTPYWGVMAKEALGGKQFEMKRMR